MSDPPAPNRPAADPSSGSDDSSVGPSPPPSVEAAARPESEDESTVGPSPPRRIEAAAAAAAAAAPESEDEPTAEGDTNARSVRRRIALFQGEEEPSPPHENQVALPLPAVHHGLADEQDIGSPPGGGSAPPAEPGTNPTNASSSVGRSPQVLYFQHQYSRPVTVRVAQGGEIMAKFRRWEDLRRVYTHLCRSTNVNEIGNGLWIDLSHVHVYTNRGAHLRGVWIEPQIVGDGETVESYLNPEYFPTEGRGALHRIYSQGRIIAARRRVTGQGEVRESTDTLVFGGRTSDVLVVTPTTHMVPAIIPWRVGNWTIPKESNMLMVPPSLKAPSSARHDAYIVLRNNQDPPLDAGIRALAFNDDFTLDLRLKTFSLPPPRKAELDNKNPTLVDYSRFGALWRARERSRGAAFLYGALSLRHTRRELSFELMSTVMQFVDRRPLSPMELVCVRCGPDADHNTWYCADRNEHEVDNRDEEGMIPPGSVSVARSADVPDDRIVLMSNDGSKITINREAAQGAGLFANLDVDGNEFQFNFHSSVLRELTQFISLEHEGIPMSTIERPLTTDQFSDLVEPHFFQLVEDRPLEFVFDLMAAADFIEVNGLVDLACAFVASKIKGKDNDEIRENFGVEDDFTEAEKDQVLRENVWCGHLLRTMAESHAAWL